MPYSNPQDKITSNRRYRQEHPIEIARYQKEWTKNNRPKRRAYNKTYHYKTRLDVLQNYGGIPPRCACCEENQIQFLCMDHINGNGSKHRKTMGAPNIYVWLKTHDYPKGFRVLCYNCNMAFGLYDKCPHRLSPLRNPSRSKKPKSVLF